MANYKEWTLSQLSLFVTFVISGICVNIIQAALFFTIGQISRRFFRKINYYLNWIINAQILFLGTWWSNSSGFLYCESQSVLDHIGKDRGLVTMNHHYEVDWMFGYMGAENYKVLGNARVFMKKMLQYVPVIGWSWFMSDVVFLERDWDKDKLNLAKSVQNLCQYPDPMWLLIFAEGTRVDAVKLKASQEFASKRNLPLLQHHLVPRTKGFVETIKSLDKNLIPSLYDVTLAMAPNDPASVSSMLCGRKSVGHMYVRRYAMSDLPSDDQGLSDFLMNLYKEKDELKDNFLKTGSFSSKTKFPVHEKIELKPTMPVLVISFLLNVAVNLPIMFYLGKILMMGSIVHTTIASIVITALYFMLKKFINLTKISKASSYGVKKDK